MSNKIKLADINKLFKDLDVESLEGVTIEGDIELNISGGGGLNPALAYALGHEAAQISLHIANISRMLGYPVDQLFAEGLGLVPSPATVAEPAIQNLIESKFEVAKIAEWNTPIEEITLGATSADGGSRKSTVTLGGEKAMPYYFDAEMPHRNYVTMDVFDIPISMAKTVKSNYEDVMEDPAEWAKKVVKDFNADMVTIHLISTDPLINDTPAREAAKVVEDVLQAVDVPIVIGGSGNPQKDPEVLERAAEVAEGERALLASASLNLDYERVAKAATDHGHAVLSWTQLEINAQKELNRKLMKQCNVPRDSIVMDPTTAALGYGLDYAYSNMERIRLSALMGDTELNFPMSSGTTNAWGARESWMKESPLKEDSDWGPREYRGPIWEIVTGLTLSLAGNDLFMMMHPTSVQVLKEITQTLFGSIESRPTDINSWVTAEV
ncbi:CO dehydrogenase/acetyl-CoA synthase subunit delta [Methanohalophilus sp.]|uniref:CO dehydrogenase/acetyl-CoA synthase subunit delta n=1 Tax=Methanohalophilus sp. TaxID=1966352 RepID=UPI0026230518|nr:CO dehydrogenase/acetyl-CoA synthase subunit delta [Methanohalophilus sp.]MDK2891700.1 acetyl-CoA decarbonylase/synthase, complex subunit delta [Methanohalophilus sp.]